MTKAPAPSPILAQMAAECAVDAERQAELVYALERSTAAHIAMRLRHAEHRADLAFQHALDALRSCWPDDATDAELEAYRMAVIRHRTARHLIAVLRRNLREVQR